MTSSDPVIFNPLEPGFTENPYPQYQRLRDGDPIHEHPLGFWFLSRYEDASALLRAASLSVEDRNLADGPVRDQYDTISAENEHTVVNYSMLDRDPPDHTRLRSLVTKVFTPARWPRWSRGSPSWWTRRWTGSPTPVRWTWWRSWLSRCRSR